MRSSIRELFPPKITTALSWILFVVPFIAYGLCVSHYAVNVPFLDDYITILDFTNTFTQAQTAGERLALLFSQHNEHRLVFGRIVLLCNYYILHEVNFKSYILCGNVGWLLATGILFLYFKKTYQISMVGLLPVPYLLLSFRHFENMFWATAAMQNYWFVLFSVLFLMSLVKDKTLWICALFPVALCTSGGGVVLYPLGNLFLALRQKWKTFALFLGVSTVSMVVYFYNYEAPSHHPRVFEAIVSPGRSVEYFLSFLGNITPINEISPFIGFILCLMSVYFVITRSDDDFLRLLVGYVALITLATTLARSGFGVWEAGASRYSLFPLLLLVCLHIFIITSIPKPVPGYRIVVMITTVCAILFWGIAAAYIEMTRYFAGVKEERIASIVAFRNGEKDKLLHPDKDRAAGILLSAEQRHIYNYHNQLP